MSATTPRAYQAAIKLGEGGFERSLMIVETID